MASISSESLLEEAMKLPDEDRARLASALVASLDGPADEGTEDAWARQVEQRARQVLAGEVTPRIWSDVRQQLLGRLGK